MCWEYRTDFEILMKRGINGLASLWTRSTWLMQIPGVHLQILVTQTSICSVHNTLNCSHILEFEFPEFWACSCGLKNSQDVYSQRLRNPGEIRPSLTALSKQASAQNLWQPQSLSIASEQACQIPPVGHVNELWLHRQEINQQEEMRKGRFEVETHTHLLTEDQRQDHKPTFWVLMWHTPEICRGQTGLRTTWRVIGLIFQFHSDYAVGFPPVAIVGH